MIKLMITIKVNNHSLKIKIKSTIIAIVMLS